METGRRRECDGRSGRPGSPVLLDGHFPADGVQRKQRQEQKTRPRGALRLRGFRAHFRRFDVGFLAKIQRCPSTFARAR